MSRPRDLWALLEKAEGRIDFLGRRQSAAVLLRESEALAGGLAAQGLRPGDLFAIFLPNVPTALVALFASARLGVRALLLDPRADEAALEGRLEAAAPRLLLTQNPAPLFDRMLRLLPACPADMPVVVGRFTDLLPFPRNLFAPLLRGGALATLPPHPRFLDYGRLLARPGAVLPAGPTAPPPLELPDRPLQARELMAKIAAARPAPAAGQRWLVAAPLAREKTLAAVLRGLHDGAELLLSPRLDDAALDRLERQAKPSGRIG